MKVGLLDGKVAIITGSGRGQGEATARLFVEQGARVVLTDLDEAAVQEVARSLGDKAIGLMHDIADEVGWAGVVMATMNRFGSIDTLINNAGIFLTGGIDTATAADMDRAFRINVCGAFLGISKVAPRMTGGSIINIASGAGLVGMADMVAYATSKWALRGLSKAVARDLAPRGIRVNAICPGVIDTPMIRNDEIPDFFDRIKQGIPLGRVGVPGDIAGASLFLASDASSFMTGAELVIDGGRHA
jgi:3alpha(or 20beta)-hydroxysteroid dehydrogenase